MKRLPPLYRFLLGGFAILAAYVAVVALLLAGGSPTRHGPLSYGQPELTAPLPGAVGLSKALDGCFMARDTLHRYKVVGGMVAGGPTTAVTSSTSMPARSAARPSSIATASPSTTPGSSSEGARGRGSG